MKNNKKHGAKIDFEKRLLRHYHCYLLCWKLLSLGAVYSIFAGFYFWLPVFTGLKVPEELSKIHFWVTFIGVNLTFFPMHFVGLAGMPRRIPDYADAYSGWNSVASFGSMVTNVGILYFFYIVYVTVYVSQPERKTVASPQVIH